MTELFYSLPYVASFLLGIMSFFTPCILPLIPAYISYITGLSVEELKSEDKKIISILISTSFFCLGFSLVFTILGATATIIGKFLSQHIDIIQIIAGIFVILFGLHMLGLVRIRTLFIEKRLVLKRNSLTYLSSFIIGIGFAAGWSPCIGPILSTILSMAANSETVYKGTILLFIYSIGLSLCFIVMSMAIRQFVIIFNSVKKYFKILEIIIGIVLLVIGIIMISGKFFNYSMWINSL